MGVMQRKRYRCAIASLVAMSVLTLDADADTVLTRKAESFRSLKIIGFKQARLETADQQSGQSRLFDFGDVAMIRVDGATELNAAEKYVMLRQNDKAVQAYRQALQACRGGWQEIWMKARLLSLYASSGQVETLATTYGQLAAIIPEWVIQIAPQSTDIAGDGEAKKRAAAHLMELRNLSTSARERDAMNRFLQRLGYELSPADRDKSPARDVSESEVLSMRRPGAWLDAWAEKKLQSGQAKQVGQTADRLFASAVRADLPAILYWQGRSSLEQEKFDAAAIQCLRVVIEFPGSRYAPFALYYAASSLDRSGRDREANALWREFVEQFGNNQELLISQRVDMARQRLNRK
jgi:tetratricopeptide (TPR) repeat protein